MKSTLSLLFILSILFSTCKDDECMNHSCGFYSSIIIGSTISGGWNLTNDTMRINEKNVQYHNQCQNNNETKNYTILCDEWNLLISKVDIAAFNKLDIHTCNSCVDGTDYSLSIKTDTSYNKITFGADYPENTPVINNLFTEIQKLRDEFRIKTCSN